MDVIIFAYTREQAINDGVLIDVTKMAKEAGFRHPTALTCAVWNEYVQVPDGVTGQDPDGRLWDILWMLRFAICRDGRSTEQRFQLYVRNKDESPAELVTLKAHCGPGDDHNPVITIMLPHED